MNSLNLILKPWRVLAGKKQATRTVRQPKSHHVESLEARQLFAVCGGLNSGVLTLNGTWFSDNVRVEIAYNNPFTSVDDQVRVSNHGSLQCLVPKNLVSKIAFYGGYGHDTFRNETTIATYADGGNGNDVLIGGGGNDTLLGRAGNDAIDGRGGHDALFGGDHGDWLYGGDGNDNLYGEGGYDELYGQKDNDWLDGGRGAKDYLDGGLGSGDRLVQHRSWSWKKFKCVVESETLADPDGAEVYTKGHGVC
jgi:hypothetical protein